MRPTFTAQEMIEQLNEQCPQMRALFRDPRNYRHWEQSKESNLNVSDSLAERITLIFQMNDVDFTLRHYPGKGWSVGAVIPAGLKGFEFEVLPSPKNCNRFPGHAMLGLLWSLVVDGRWNPVVMTSREWCTRTEPVRKVRIDP